MPGKSAELMTFACDFLIVSRSMFRLLLGRHVILVVGMAEVQGRLKVISMAIKWHRENDMNDEQAIRDLIATWLRATAAGDIDQVLTLMTDDVVFVTPGQKPFGK